MDKAYVNLNNIGIENLVNDKDAIDASKADFNNVVDFDGNKYIIFAECYYSAFGFFALKDKEKVIDYKSDLYARIHRLIFDYEQFKKDDEYKDIEVFNDFSITDEDIIFLCNHNDVFSKKDILMVKM